MAVADLTPLSGSESKKLRTFGFTLRQEHHYFWGWRVKLLGVVCGVGAQQERGELLARVQDFAAASFCRTLVASTDRQELSLLRELPERAVVTPNDVP